jgi:prepilin-type N-terminal cleavage/methylation domain-containing protein
MKLPGILGRTVPLAPRQRIAAFTLLELLVVVAVIGLLAGITVPAIRGMVQGKTLSSGHRQLTDDLNRARQEALRLRTTVYVVFAPTNVWQTRMALDAQIDSMVAGQLAPQRFREQALRSFTNIALGVFHSYALLVEREIGAQTLPDGVILSPKLFFPAPVAPTDRRDLVIHELPQRLFRFPLAEFPGDTLPAIPMRFVAFGPDGRLALAEMNLHWALNDRPELQLPPLSEVALGVGQGSVFISRNASGQIDPSVVPDAIETPRDNATNNRVIVSSLTGRSRILKPVLR